MAGRDTRDTSRARARKPADWQPVFLEAFAETGVVKSACRIAGVSRATVYRHREEDEAFAALWADAEADAGDVLEAEAVRRAVVGTERPVFQGGVEVGRIREFSDRMLELLLKARKPEKFGDKKQLELGGSVGLHFALSPDEQHGSADRGE